MICNGDVMSYDDGIVKIVHPENKNLSEETILVKDRVSQKDLDGFMIGRASFGNPWCFLPGGYEPTFEEILTTMSEHGKLLWQWKERKGMMEARKHLVQYLHGFPGVKEYRSELVHVEGVEDIENVIAKIRLEHPTLLGEKISSYNPESAMTVW